MSKADVKFPSAPDTSAIDIQDEGSVIVSNPTALNFTGPGVTVTENPTGTAEVDIPGLQYWTESEDATTQQSTIFTPNNAATDVNAVIQPKGNGANTAQKPDGTTVGGNARGEYATDWQKRRTQADQVASGNFSIIAGGEENKSSGNYSMTAGSNNLASGLCSIGFGANITASGQFSMAAGLSCAATGAYSMSFSANGIASGSRSAALGGTSSSAINTNTVVTGEGALAYLPGMKSHGFVGLLSQGQMQHSDVPIGTFTSLPDLTTGATEIIGAIAPNGNNRVWNVVAKWTAAVVGITGTAIGVNVGDFMTQCNLFGFKKVGGTGSITTITTVATHGDASLTGSASMAYTSSSNSLLATFTAPTFAGGGSVQMRIAVKYELVEFAW